MEEHFQNPSETEENFRIRKRDFFSKLDSMEGDHEKEFALVKQVLTENRHALLFLYIERSATYHYLISNKSYPFTLTQLTWVIEHLPKPIQQTPDYIRFYDAHKQILKKILLQEEKEKGQISLNFLKGLLTPDMPILSMQYLFLRMLDAGLHRIAKDTMLNP
jgi:hypothetical protein